MLGVSSAVVAQATAAVGGQLQSRAVSGQCGFIACILGCIQSIR